MSSTAAEAGRLDTVRLRDGRTLSYATNGPTDGRPVIYCHSLPGSHVQPHFAEGLMQERNIFLVTPDRPGFGRSDFQPGRKVADWADDVAQLADALGLASFAVLGISAGSPYVLACCARIPERVTRAAIVGGITPLDPPSLIHSVAPRPVSWLVRRSRPASYAIHTALVTGMRRQPHRAIEAMSKSPSAVDTQVLGQPEVGRFVLELSLAAAEQGVRGWVYDDRLLGGTWDVGPADVSPDVHIDLWYGDEDPAVPMAHAREYAAALPNASLHELSGEAHFSVIFHCMPTIFGVLLD